MTSPISEHSQPHATARGDSLLILTGQAPPSRLVLQASALPAGPVSAVYGERPHRSPLLLGSFAPSHPPGCMGAELTVSPIAGVAHKVSLVVFNKGAA